MPQYITRQDIIRRIGESDFTLMADRNRDGQAEEDPVNMAIEDAEAEANSYVGSRYSLPLPDCESDDPTANTVPDQLKRLCVDIAVYRLCDTHDMLTEERRRRYEDATKWLTKLVQRLVNLGVSEASIPPTLHGGVFRTGPDRLMTRDGLKGLL